MNLMGISKLSINCLKSDFNSFFVHSFNDNACWAYCSILMSTGAFRESSPCSTKIRFCLFGLFSNLLWLIILKLAAVFFGTWVFFNGGQSFQLLSAELFQPLPPYLRCRWRVYHPPLHYNLRSNIFFVKNLDGLSREYPSYRFLLSLKAVFLTLCCLR